MRRIPFPIALLGVIAALTTAGIDAQRPAAGGAGPAFDVVSVKRVPRGTPPSLALGIAPGEMAVRPGGRFAAPWVTVRDLVRVAYGVNEVQVAGGPDWVAPDRFDVEGITRPDVTAGDARAMIRTLLADRFGLAARTEQRELPVSVLGIARSDRRLGPQLRRSGPECQPPSRPPGLAFVPAPPPPPPGGTGPSLRLSSTPIRCLTLQVSWHISLREVTMDYFAARLIPVVERLVVNRTGLEGPFDLDLTFMPAGVGPPMVNGAPITVDAPALGNALREQLGLKLETERAPVDVVVIEGVKAPAEN